VGVADDVELDAVLQPSLGIGKHESKAAGGIDRATNLRVGIALQVEIAHLDKSVAAARGKCPFDRADLFRSSEYLPAGTSSFTSIRVETPYISQAQVTGLPTSSLALPPVNQNFVVTAGSTKAS